MKPTEHAVAVVGGGIVGSAVALHLCDLGVRPVLVDAGPPGSPASALSFASISAFGKDPVDHYELACAGMGRLVAREVAGGPAQPLLDAFRPGRFAARAAALPARSTPSSSRARGRPGGTGVARAEGAELDVAVEVR